MALIYRAYFAFIKNPRITTQGIDTGAILGFTNTLLEIIRTEQPTYIVAAFDTVAPTFRHQIFKAYKAHRETQPEAITQAIPYIKQMIQAFQIPVVEKEGYEADDIIGTLATQAATQGLVAYMMTPDKDFGQLVSDRIFLYQPALSGRKSMILGKEDICTKWGIQHVEQVCDMLGLQGDASDNIPGIPNIGPKTAQKLIQQFGTLENIVANAEQLRGRLKDNVIAYAHQGRLSKKLATICTEVPLDFSLQDSQYSGPDITQVGALCQTLELYALLERVRKYKHSDASAAQKIQSTLPPAVPTQVDEEEASSLVYTLYNTPHQYHLIDTPALRTTLIHHLHNQDVIALDTETTGLDPYKAQLLGIAFAYYPGEAYYVPVPPSHELAQPIVQAFQQILSHPKILKVGQNLKYDITVLQRYGAEVHTPLFDTMLAHYLLEPDKRHSLNSMAKQYLNYDPLPIETLIGSKGKKQKTLQEVDKQLVKEYACEDADITLQLYHKLSERLTQDTAIQKLFYDIELPLLQVLTAMERAGVLVDAHKLHTLSKEMEGAISALAQDIYTLAGEKFNIDAPKQLGSILFENLKLVDRPIKTKTGQYATGEEILQRLTHKHPIITKIIAYRALQKLKSTYIDALPKLIQPSSQRIHTSYNQAVTVTGRLSSTHPNLQNIPIRTLQGRNIRKAFVPRHLDYVLLSADYSQIELRIMASFAQDETMIAAFHSRKDIHQATASKLFGVAMENVTDTMRRQAKTANFGIIYGVSAFGLAQRLHITRNDASKLIQAYFKEFPAVKAYMEAIVQQAKRQGYVTTLLGRKRLLPDVRAKNAVLRGFAQRNAINSPIQGTAAEMIKLAMIRIYQWIQAQQLRTRMILQVHDELVFDTHKEEVDLVKYQVAKIMQEALPLKVPIEVDIKLGLNWLDMDKI